MTISDAFNAVMDADQAALESLIRSGLQPAASTPKEKWNLLHMALMTPWTSPQPRMIAWLIDWGVDVNAVDMYGNVPLHYAARQNTAEASEIMKLLLQAGAAVDILNKDTVSPLRQSLAGVPGNLAGIRALLERGADMNQKIPGGRSVREVVELNVRAHPELKKLIAEFASP